MATVGDGRPVLLLSGWLSHLELGWREVAALSAISQRAVSGADFADVQVERYRLHTPFVLFNPQIAGTARA